MKKTSFSAINSTLYFTGNHKVFYCNTVATSKYLQSILHFNCPLIISFNGHLYLIYHCVEPALTFTINFIESTLNSLANRHFLTV